jgi:hypothetical protein
MSQVAAVIGLFLVVWLGAAVAAEPPAPAGASPLHAGYTFVAIDPAWRA